MEIPTNPLTIHQSMFFNNLRSILPEKIYFYGSILRNDYLPGLSDIDALYFTKDALKDTVKNIVRFLSQDPTVTRLQQVRFLYHSFGTKKVISGYKIKYTNLSKALIVEISLYDDNYKDLILEEQMKKVNLPFYVVWGLLILKILAYKYHFLPENTFRMLKDRIFINMSGVNNTFLPVENDEE